MYYDGIKGGININTKEFIQSLNQLHGDEIVSLKQTKQAKEQAKKFLDDYFSNLYFQLDEVLQVSNRIKFYEDRFYEIVLDVNNLIHAPKYKNAENVPDTFEVAYRNRGSQKKDILYIEKAQFVSKNFGLPLSERLMDQYLDAAFGSVFEKQ
ncbi:hypothetical protein ACDI16_04290 [Oceanobacillus caeni]|uniref:hypothetical protein n=1 Tax=Virgibacillus sp. SK37 TaxID=403957 RepID=UPI0011A4ECCE|nr:hypothetical protein [Virgibacillus sp. SK37]